MRRRTGFPLVLAMTGMATIAACTPAPGGAPQGIPATPATLGVVNTLKGSLPTSGKVLLIETGTNEATLVTLENGKFTTSLKPGKYAVAMVDQNNQPTGLLIQNGASIFDLRADTDLGALSLDATARTLTTVSPLTTVAPLSTVAPYLVAARRTAGSSLDLTDMVSLRPEDTAATPKAIDVAKVLSSQYPDADGDLVPNFLDNDNNENGRFDNEEGLDLAGVRIEAALDASGVAELRGLRPIVFDNLKLDSGDLKGDGDSQPYTDRHVLAIHLGVSNSLAALITSVEAVSLPAFADGTIIPAAGGYNFPTGYPTAGTAWSASGYKLPLAEQGGNKLYSLWVQPKADPAPSVLQFKVTLRTGTVAYLTTRLFYVFNTPAKVTTINGAAVTYPIAPSAPGTRNNWLPIPSAATSITMQAKRPLTTAGGVPIFGMGVQAHIFYLNSAGVQIGGTITNPVPDTDFTKPLEFSLDRATYFPTTYASQTVAGYQVDFTVIGRHGDNTAEMFWLKN